MAKIEAKWSILRNHREARVGDCLLVATNLERQIGEQGIRCYKCGHISKNLRGNSAHLRSHR